MGAAEAKRRMKCGQVSRSYLKGKKVMQKVCKNGSARIVHAGDTKYRHNYSDSARKNFRARHNCKNAKAGTAKALACSCLWKKKAK
ncbi:hypothetical protein CYMTET_11468 [Cymbomonas tetramitiformis]|uniref:Uncharacterized protein n=1 Tax=Cymbomonas tetramitiformis TaxID=36881 RepID=A0AAE0LDG0_9CHLO|nr:hypothetical protein CYMTET_57061 [Cymbomonas tetramitiformis]KAK3236978.1 hypothetical protein CYMTET_52915 [Cymbomonas tetramitiformis]KAK3280714.1 hypothetical protein CYMTET_11468 [Cymbomonas tetramitiformis]